MSVVYISVDTLVTVLMPIELIIECCHYLVFFVIMLL